MGGKVNEKAIKTDREDDRPAGDNPGGGSGSGADLGRVQSCQPTSDGERAGVGVGDLARDDGAVMGENVASEPVTQADPDALAKLPHVAEKIATEAPEKVPHVASKNVLPFATRGTVKSRKQKRKSATRGKSRPVVEAGKGSKGTWQIRLRWNSEPGRPVEYVATITDAVYDLIRNGDYESYKQQTIASYEARTVSARHTA